MEQERGAFKVESLAPAAALLGFEDASQFLLEL
jgi:hypothetical protein